MKRPIILVAGLALAGAAGFGAVLLASPGADRAAKSEPAATEVRTDPAPAESKDGKGGCSACGSCSEATSGPRADSASSIIVLDEDGQPTAPTADRQVPRERERTVRPVEVPTKAAQAGIASIVEVDVVETWSVAVVDEDGNLTVHCEIHKNAKRGGEAAQ